MQPSFFPLFGIFFPLPFRGLFSTPESDKKAQKETKKRFAKSAPAILPPFWDPLAKERGGGAPKKSSPRRNWRPLANTAWHEQIAHLRGEFREF